MGTVPLNFPPEILLEIGQLLTGTKLGATAGFGPTVFFTAPTTGLYEVGFLCRIIATDGVGTLAFSITFPHTAAIPVAAFTPALDNDQSAFPKTVWLAGGESISVTATAAGLGATSYNLYVPAFRVF